MSIADLSSIRAWQPTLTQYAGPAETGVGDPAACLDDAGNVHWATVLWTTGLGAEPTGRLVVDGVELVQRGATGHFDWVPEMAWVRGRGLMLLIVAPSGKAMVGLVQGNQLIPVAEVPSAAPEFGNPPVNRIASYGESYYISTIYGLWAHHVVPPVGASGFVSLLAGAIALGALAVLAVRRRRVEA